MHLEAPNILTKPSGSISILVLVFSIISRIVLPPVPIIAPILSGLMLITTNLGTNSESSGVWLTHNFFHFIQIYAI